MIICSVAIHQVGLGGMLSAISCIREVILSPSSPPFPAQAHPSARTIRPHSIAAARQHLRCPNALPTY